MTLRAYLAATVFLISGPALAAPPAAQPSLFERLLRPAPIARPAPAARPVVRPGPAVRPKPAPLPTPPMVFYVVRGAPDACGRGCDRWIAAEGQIDSNAAPRFRRFLRQVRDHNLPIYFSSPGGNLEQAVAMGAMLRERPVIAQVGRSVVKECGFEAQNGDVCVRLKQSGRVLNGALSTRGASCGSACPYLMLSAATREIAPDAVLGVHSSRVIVHYRGEGVPTEQMRLAATARGLQRADRLLLEYLVKIGADTRLLELARTIRNEDMHALTREEIARFGIDRREFVETPWAFDNAGGGVVRKVVTQSDDGGKTFRLSQWRLYCNGNAAFQLDFQRPAVTSSVFPTVAISNGGSIPQYFTLPVRRSGFENWSLRMTKAAVQALIDAPQFDVAETSQTPDSRRSARKSSLSSEGLAGAVESLLATCPAPNLPPPLQASDVRESAAK